MHAIWRTLVRLGALQERTLRMLMPLRMAFVHYSWPLRPSICPCDLHFCEYLRDRNIRNKRIFHLGTGGHHLVGLHNQQYRLANEILGLTLSPGEHSKYVARVIRNPILGAHYRVLFADLYTLSAACLPSFDLATLFHLSEFSGATHAGAADHPVVPRMNDAQTLRLFYTQVVYGGLILLYRGSFGYHRCRGVIERAIAEGHLEFVENYKTLDVFRVTSTLAVASA